MTRTRGGPWRLAPTPGRHDRFMPKATRPGSTLRRLGNCISRTKFARSFSGYAENPPDGAGSANGWVVACGSLRRPRRIMASAAFGGRAGMGGRIWRGSVGAGVRGRALRPFISKTRCSRRCARGHAQQTRGVRDDTSRRGSSGPAGSWRHHQVPWNWGPAHGRSGTQSLHGGAAAGSSTIRCYQMGLRLFSEYLCA